MTRKGVRNTEFDICTVHTCNAEGSANTGCPQDSSLVTTITCCDPRSQFNSGGPRSRLAIIRSTASTFNAKGFMDEVTPWIKDYFLHLATIYGSHFDTVPPTEKVKRCQLKKVRRAVSIHKTTGIIFWGLGFNTSAEGLLLGRSLGQRARSPGSYFQGGCRAMSQVGIIEQSIGTRF